MEVKNKVAIVTGGAGGIGFATVQALLKNGVKHVAIFDLEDTKCRAVSQLQKLVGDYGTDGVSFVACDVTNSKQFEDCFDQVAKSQNGVDLLVNNAGVLNESQGNLMIDINLKGVVNCTVAAIERMGKHKNGKGGIIVNVSSTAGLLPASAVPIYNATKSAVLAFTRSLKEHYPYIGVRVVGMCPSVTHTDIIKKDWRGTVLKFVDDKIVDNLYNYSIDAQPPENVAEAIVKMVKEAEAGDIWVSEENKPPFAVADPPHYQNRKLPLQ